MSQQPPSAIGAAPTEEGRTPYMRVAVWISIGALIAAALVCVVWVLIGDQNGIVGRAFLTILLLAAFAGVALLDASLAPNRPQWYILLSMIGWVVILLAGAVKIWLPFDDYRWDEPASRFFQFVGIVLVIRLAILHVWLYLRAHLKKVTPFTHVVVIVTIGLVAVLAVLLILPLTFSNLEYGEYYWRIVVAVTILAALGTALVPLVNALNAPRRPSGPRAAPVLPPATPPLQAWPTYADGVTPLPWLPDGSPDWNAYYTGYPTYAQPQTPPQVPTQAEVAPPVFAPIEQPYPPTAAAPPQPPAGSGTQQPPPPVPPLPNPSAG